MNRMRQPLCHNPRPSGSGHIQTFSFHKLANAVCFGLLILVVLTSAAQADEKKKSAKKKHFLWKVQSKTATVYLLGSIHAAKKDFYPLDAVITKAFQKSDKVVFEVPMDRATVLDAGQKMVKAAAYPAGDSLSSNLDKSTKKLLDAHLKKINKPAAAFERFRPWFVAILLTMMELKSTGFAADHGIDQHFSKKAQVAGKPTLALESIDDQVGMFRGLSTKIQQKMLKQTLEEIGTAAKTLEKVFVAWKAGNAKTLDELMLKPMRTAEYKPLYKSLFTDRNKKMAAKIEGYLKTKSTYFVVVGSGHLVGKEGLVEMLRAKKGLRIEQE